MSVHEDMLFGQRLRQGPRKIFTTVNQGVENRKYRNGSLDINESRYRQFMRYFISTLSREELVEKTVSGHGIRRSWIFRNNFK